MMATASGLAQAPLVTAARGGAGCSTRKGAVPIQRAGRAGRPQIAVSAVRHALPVGARRRTGTSRVLQRVQAIGFVHSESSGDARVDRRAETALRDVASLLVFQQAMQGPPAQAFKKVLHALRAQKDIEALTAYGEFFSLLAAGGYPGWTDYVIDQIFQGNNAFAVDVAKGNQPSPALKLAAAADLDTLQRLCIAETTLAKWVGDSSGVHDSWLKASAAFKDSYRPSDAVREAAASVVAAVVAASGGAGLVSAPVISAERAEWRKRLGERWRWSEGGVEDLVAYYRRAGVGAIAESSVLLWKEQRLQPFQAPSPTHALLSCHREQYDAIHANTQRHMAGLPSHHVLIHGAPGGGKSYLLWKSASASFASGLRLVIVQKAELRTLSALARELSANPRVRFVVLCEDLGVLPFQDVWAELVQLLGSAAWPANALVYATALRHDALRPGSTPAEALSGGAALKALFGLRLEVPQLTQEQFLACVRELRAAVAAAARRGRAEQRDEEALLALAEVEEGPGPADGGAERGGVATFGRTALADKAARATAEAWEGAWAPRDLPEEDRVPVAWAMERGCGLCVQSAVQYVEEEAMAMASAGASGSA